MHICYATDDNFCMQTCVSMASLSVFNPATPFTFHLLDAGVSPAGLEKLRAVASRAGAAFHRYDVMPFLERVRRTGQKSWGDFPTHATWARLFLPELLPAEVGRILYLDGDVICDGDMSGLGQLDMAGACVAGAEDCVSLSYKNSLGLCESQAYLNAGVLLFDLDAWRARYDPHWVEAYLSGRPPYPMADQDVINLMFRGQCLPLPLRYNFSAWFRALDLRALQRLFQTPRLCRYTQADINFCRGHAVFIHYNTCSLLVRPWYRDADDPAAGAWKRLYDASDWANEPLPMEPPHLSQAESKDRRLYRRVGKRWFSLFHSAKRRLNALRPHHPHG